MVIGSQNIIKYPRNGFLSSLEIGYTDKKIDFCVGVCAGGGHVLGRVFGGRY